MQKKRKKKIFRFVISSMLTSKTVNYGLLLNIYPINPDLEYVILYLNLNNIMTFSLSFK